MPKDEVNQNNPQWKKLQAMRGVRTEATSDAVGTPIEVTGDQPRNEDGTYKKVDAPPTPEAIKAETDKLAAEATAAKKVADDEAAAAAVAATQQPEPPKPATPPTATSVEIEIDGQKMQVAPEIAAAFHKAEGIKKDAVATEERAKLKAELKAELQADLPPPKTAAEKAAEEALKAAEIAAKLPKEPDSKLLISDPDEYAKQKNLYDEARLDAAVKKAKADTVAEIESKQQKTLQTQQQQAEEQARALLRERFYQQYPVLRDSSDIVDNVLTEKFNEVLASGRLNKPLPPVEAEELQRTSFADVATRATKKIVKVMNAGKAVLPPVTPPPTLASSAPVSVKPPKADEPAKTKDKYPAGSVSKSLAEVRARKLAASA
jgi:hypothetical protein